jgi:ubiquinone/menaquinone biosynthesis C-methylase UbiE
MKTAAERAAEQAALWNGSVGDMWLEACERRIERDLRMFGQAALDAAAPRPGERVLDIGCGTGGTTVELARAVAPDGEVLGVDISEKLVSAARRQGIGNARFAVSDAGTYRFEAAAFDLAFSRFGVMFFGDPVAAFKNLHGALRRDGRLVFVCWRTPKENPWGLVPFLAAVPHLPPIERPGPEDPGQYSFGDRARVERILKEASFAAPSFRQLDQPMRLGWDVAEALDNLSRFGPLARPLAEAPTAAAEKAKGAIAAGLAPYESRDGVSLPGAVWLVAAKAT